jgi:hypothetical protein
MGACGFIGGFTLGRLYFPQVEQSRVCSQIFKNARPTSWVYFVNKPWNDILLFWWVPMFLKSDPYRVWCSIFYSKLVNCILLRSLLCSTFVLWKVGEHAVVEKETLKFALKPRRKSRPLHLVWWALLSHSIQAKKIISCTQTGCKIIDGSLWCERRVSGMTFIQHEFILFCTLSY